MTTTQQVWFGHALDILHSICKVSAACLLSFVLNKTQKKWWHWIF